MFSWTGSEDRTIKIKNKNHKMEKHYLLRNTQL